MTMIELTKDKKSPMWIITTTDNEGFHRQLPVTMEQMDKLIKMWTDMKTACRSTTA